MDTTEPVDFKELAFVKGLVVSDKVQRDRASKAFERWLSVQGTLSAVESRKLWKALFYGTLWMDACMRRCCN